MNTETMYFFASGVCEIIDHKGIRCKNVNAYFEMNEHPDNDIVEEILIGKWEHSCTNIRKPQKTLRKFSISTFFRYTREEFTKRIATIDAVLD